MVVSKNNYPRAATRRKKSQNSKVIFFAPKCAYRSLTQPWHAKIADPDLQRRLRRTKRTTCRLKSSFACELLKIRVRTKRTWRFAQKMLGGLPSVALDATVPDNIRNPVLIRLPWAVKAKVPKETCRCGEATQYSNGRELWQRAAVSRRTGRYVVRERKCHGLNLNLLRKLVIYHKPLLLRKYASGTLRNKLDQVI
jgi:hypothetical protein